MNDIINKITSFGGSLFILLTIIATFLLNRWLFQKIRSEKEKVTIARQVISVIIILIGALAFTISLPIDKSLKGQIISLIGIVLSASIALSSTTLIGNALAGIMNSSIKNFKLGDFLKIEDNFGRVTKKGLFRTEIQTEDRNLTSLPNLYLATKPMKIVRDSGTIISTIVSLGYDLSHSEIEKHLLKAAEKTGLKDPFVFIDKLGDFSVTYRINGMLTDLNKYFTTRSLLNINVMDSLHENRIEIVSPTFMNQRQVNENRFIPVAATSQKDINEKNLPENIVFDKAIEADKIEEKEEYVKKIDKQIDELKQNLKDGGEKDKINEKIKQLEKNKKLLKENIEDQKNNLEQHK